ncbi:SAF domain-containing protein [Pedococcus bigeumensis]|nr:SAF domain-containing protein [Pedococcus bigeumensis]
MPGTRVAAGALGWLHGPGRRRRWRRQVVRRGLAMTCAVGAAFGVLAVARTGDSRPLVRVVVAVRPMAIGQIASPGSLREVWWPAELAPESRIHRLDEVLGRPMTVPLSPGEPLTRTRVTRGSMLAGQPVDSVAVHVSVPDHGAVSMVSAGDRVDLWGPDGAVARAVVVLSVDQSSRTDFGAVIQGQGSSSGYAVDSGGVVVSAGQEVAARILAVPEDALGRPQIELVLTHGWPEAG